MVADQLNVVLVSKELLFEANEGKKVTIPLDYVRNKQHKLQRYSIF